jgi:uncharacterized protein (DUF2235 family)
VGRIFSLIFSFFGLFVSASAIVWWFNTFAIGLFLRRLERVPVIRQGSLTTCIAILYGIWAAFSAVTIVFVVFVFFLLKAALSSWLKANLPDPYFNAGYWLVVAALSLAVLVGMFAGLSEVTGAVGASKRRRFLLNFDQPPLQNVDIPTQAGPGRRIVILCDGTSNRPDNRPEGESIATNIWRLSELLRNDDEQTVWYEAGVGSDTSSTATNANRTRYLLSITGGAQGAKIFSGLGMLIKLIESGFGVGISETVINGYRAIVRLYRPGDRIYLIGFSRGAFAARSIAGVILRCGLLRAEYERFAPDVVQIYRTRESPLQDEPLRLDMAYPGRGSKLDSQSEHPVTVEFIGAFDTVASLGFPLWGWWFRAFPIWNNIPFATDPAKVCRNIYHALAMDERRAQFFPTLYIKPVTEPAPAVLEQVWFRGAHADVGGGYTRRDLSDIPLGWMMDAMARHGLDFNPDADKDLMPNPVGTLHDELVREPTWNFFGSWPRWHPVPGPDEAAQTSRLHPSVIARAAHIQSQTGRADLLPITKCEEFVVDTKVPWFRTGLIIEKGKYYKLTYLAGLTRDGENSPTGPGGQKAGSRDFRSLPFSRPRLADRKWLFLGAAIAHPRIWTPQEQSMLKALEYLFFRAPQLLLAQIAMIGDDLATAGNEIYIWSEAPSGLLYVFVNDFWQTAGDNSGGPRVRISLVDEQEIGAGPVHVLWHFTEQAKDVVDGTNEINWWARYQSKETMPTERPLPPRDEIALWRRYYFRIKEILTAKQIKRSDA